MPSLVSAARGKRRSSISTPDAEVALRRDTSSREITCRRAAMRAFAHLSASFQRTPADRRDGRKRNREIEEERCSVRGGIARANSGDSLSAGIGDAGGDIYLAAR